MYKNAAITPRHIELVVCKAWLLYTQWQQTQFPEDELKYNEYRKLAARAIDAGKPEWKERFQLP